MLQWCPPFVVIISGRTRSVLSIKCMRDGNNKTVQVILVVVVQ
jgi:hypothetical protein